MREPLRILLTESASASAREIVTVLARRGHAVDVLEPRRDGMTVLSSAIRRRHPVPPFASDPVGYLDALEAVLADGAYDVLLPTHEQVALVSRCAERLRGAAGFAVADFAALRQVQDKAAAATLLDDLGIAQPRTRLAGDPDALRAAAVPAFVKLPISTASAGVWRADDAEGLARAAAHPAVADAFARGWSVLVQEPAEGPIAMAQTVFDRGRLVAAHTALRTRDGVRGSASSKESVALPELVARLERLGGHLGWHGALSVDAVVDQRHRGTIIDINPRLVEPVSSELAGTDLVGQLLALSLDEPVGPPPAPVRERVRTHMLMMALLRHGELGGGRLDVARELAHALTGTGPYEGSREELLPVLWDPPAALPVTAVALGMLARPGSWRSFVDGRPPGHTLTPDVWEWLEAGSPVPHRTSHPGGGHPWSPTSS